MKRGKDLLFRLPTGLWLFPFEKGECSTFFFAKKKKVPKKKLATLQVDGLASVEALSTKARSLCAEALAKLGTIRLAKGISPFTVLCRYEVRMKAFRFAWVRRRDYGYSHRLI